MSYDTDEIIEQEKARKTEVTEEAPEADETEVTEEAPEADETEVTEKAPEVPNQEKAKYRKKTLKAFIHLVIKLAVVGGIIWLALIFVFGVFRLKGNNMFPALRDGDLCITYKLGGYNAGDVVAYRKDGKLKFGRIIAKEGDRVSGNDIGVLVNGAYPSEEIFYPTQILDTNLQLPCTLGKDEFVVLNDYRSDLSDSRTYGVITKDELEGKIICIFRRRGF